MYQNYTYTGWQHIGKYIVTDGRYLTHGRYEISYNYSVLNNIDHHLQVLINIIQECPDLARIPPRTLIIIQD